MKKLFIALFMLIAASASAQITEIIEVDESVHLRPLRKNADGSTVWQFSFPDTATRLRVEEQMQLINQQSDRINLLTGIVNSLSDRIRQLETTTVSAFVDILPVSASSYTVTAQDHGKHLLFSSNASTISVNLSQVPAGFRCTIGTRGRGVIQFTGNLRSKSSFIRSQVNGTVLVTGEPGGIASLSWDIQK